MTTVLLKTKYVLMIDFQNKGTDLTFEFQLIAMSLGLHGDLATSRVALVIKQEHEHANPTFQAALHPCRKLSHAMDLV